MTSTADVAQRLGEIVATHVRSDGPGVAYAVLRDGAMVAQGFHGRAVLEQGIEVGPSSRFYLCSVAKQMTAAVVVRLHLQGVLSLDDTVGRWLPDLLLPGEPATLRHLLHHTSGVRDYLALQLMAGEEFEDGFDRGDVLTLASLQQRLEFAPGAQHAYGNTGYTLLAAVSEVATGRPWAELLRTFVFEPLGMHGALAPRTGQVVPDMAVGYSRAGGGYRRRGLRHVVPGPGGVVATIDDLVAWVPLLAGTDAAHHDVHEVLVTPGHLVDGSSTGYGGGVAIGSRRGRVTHGHGGGFPGWSTWITHLPDDGLTAIVLANDDGIAAGVVANQLLDVFLDDLGAPPAIDDEPPGPPTTSAVPGRYLDPAMGDSWDVRRDEDGELQVGKGGAWVALPLGDDGTYATPGPERIRFHDGGAEVLRNGRVSGRYVVVEPFQPVATDYVGNYDCPELGLLCEVRDQGGTLTLRRGHRPALVLAPTRADEFVTSIGTVRFERSDDGEVVRAMLDNMQVHGVVMRRTT